jgi:hypothetical protein
MTKALSRVDDLLEYVKKDQPSSDNKKGLSVLGLILGLAISSTAFFLISKKL